MWATGIATLIGDRTATFELGRRAIRGLQRSGDRLRTAITLHMIANTLATTRPEAATIIYGAAEAYVVQPEGTAQLITTIVTAALGDDRVRELRARGADMDWDEVITYTITHIGLALDDLQPQAQP